MGACLYYVVMHVCMYECRHECMYISVYVCTCIYACMYAYITEVILCLSNTKVIIIKRILLLTIVNYSLTTEILTLTLEAYENQTLFRINRSHTLKVIIACVNKIILLIK